ncbi:MAG: hypothetical protein ACREXX_10385 [Gammaproteobacteria bacterium]
MTKIWMAVSMQSAALLLGACTYSDPVRVEEDFGNSVRNMIKAQTYNPAAARNPPVEPPTVLDGTKGNRALEAYRGDIDKPAEVKQPIRIEIGE